MFYISVLTVTLITALSLYTRLCVKLWAINPLISVMTGIMVLILILVTVYYTQKSASQQ
jgi:hypothetical protein